MAMTPAEVRAQLAERREQAASLATDQPQARGPLVGPPEATRQQRRDMRLAEEQGQASTDPTPPMVATILGGARMVGEQPREFAAGVVEEALSPSSSMGIAGGLAGEKLGRPFGAPGVLVGGVGGAAIGTVVGSLIESRWENKSAATAIEDAWQLGAAGAVTDILVNRSMRLGKGLWNAGKNRVLRGAAEGELPAGGLFGNVVADAEELVGFGQEMRADLVRDLQTAGVDMRGLTIEDIDRWAEAPFRPAQLTHGEFLDTVEAWVEGSSFAGNNFRRMKEKTLTVLNAYAESWKRSLGPLVDDPRKLSKLVKAELDKVYGRGGTRSGHVSGIHKSVKNAMGGRPIDITDLAGDLADDIAEWENIAALHPDKEGVGAVLSDMKKFYRRAKDLSEGVDGVEGLSFEDVKQIRTGYREMTDALPPTSRQARKKSGGMQQKLTRKLEDALREFDASRGADPDKAPAFGVGESYLQKWKAGNKATRHLEQEKSRLRLDKLTELIDEKKEGAKAIQALVPDNISTTNLRLLRDRLGGPKSPTWERIQRWKGEQLLSKHLTRKKTDFSGLLDELELIKGTQGKEGLKEFLGREHADTLTKFARLGELSLAKNPVGSKVAVNINEAKVTFDMIKFFTTPATLAGGLVTGGPGGAAVGAASGAAAGAASGAVFIIGMRQLAKWMMDPKTADLVLTGMKPGWNKTKRGIEAVAALGARAMAEAGLEDVPVDGAEGNDDVVVIPKNIPYLELRRMHRAGVLGRQ